METIYAIVHKTRKEAYIGRTYQPMHTRFSQHLRDAANPRVEKRLSEALRHDPDGYEIIECECSATASEAEWIERFAADGYQLLNSAGGNKKPPKRRVRGAPSVAVERRQPPTAEQRTAYQKWLDETMAEFHARLSRTAWSCSEESNSLDRTS